MNIYKLPILSTLKKCSEIKFNKYILTTYHKRATVLDFGDNK